MPSLMLARLNRETKQHHAAADADRLQLLSSATSVSYVRCLSRIWGFEAPIEGVLARTHGLGDVVDLRRRTHIRRLRADLAVLGMKSPSWLPYCRTVPAFQLAEALGWMYVVEYSTMLHGELRRHLGKRIPTQLASAGTYLAVGERSVAVRLGELGVALDGLASDAETAARIVESANIAFGRQRQWFAQPSSIARRPIQVA